MSEQRGWLARLMSTRVGIGRSQTASDLIDEIGFGEAGAQRIGQFLRQGVLFALGVVALYLFAPQLLDVISQAERLVVIRWWWFVVMIGLEALSFACVWYLTRLLLPSVSWFVAATAQLVSNAVSRVVPGGAGPGGAALYRMLSVSGVDSAKAGGALAATSIIGTAALFAIPTVGLLLALVGAPVPESLYPVAVAGGVLFLLLVALGWLFVTFDRPLVFATRQIDRTVGAVLRRFGGTQSFDSAHTLDERDRLVDVVGDAWLRVVAAAAANWVLDYLVLVAALFAVGAYPRLSVVLLAYSATAVIGMIPITPGGLGFVEVALVPMLVLSGISTENALLATLAYRIVSWLLPLVAAVPAWVLYRRRFPPDPVRLSRPATDQRERHDRGNVTG